MSGWITRLSEVASIVEGTLVGEDLPFHGVSTDSRTVSEGALFVALQGPNFNGDRFVSMAASRGAVAALVSEAQPDPLPQIVVKDTLVALGQLAKAWRAQFDGPVIAITGSNGKTTVKEMVATILRQLGPGTVTAGNLNNEIGVPLTLLKIKPEDRWAVIEMGANGPGEIERLTAMAQPQLGLVNNAGAAHLGGFGSREGVVQAKGELYAGLSTESTALISRELPEAEAWLQLAEDRVVQRYGYWRGRVVSGEVLGEVEMAQPFRLYYGEVSVTVELPLPGIHNRYNAIAAAALAIKAGATLQQVKVGLEQMSAVAGRLQSHQLLSGTTLIDDSYNASPESVRSALAVLATAEGQRFAVLGDMAELGEESALLHREIGVAAREAEIEQLYATGVQGVEYVAGFGEGGHHFETVEALITALRPMMQERTTVLVKGSRFMKMERVVNALLDGEGERP